MMRRRSRWPRRRTFATALVAILIALAFETGVHSAHHLDPQEDGAACAVASAAGHLAGLSVDTAGADGMVLPRSDLAVTDREWTPGVRAALHHRGRAPPPRPASTSS